MELQRLQERTGASLHWQDALLSAVKTPESTLLPEYEMFTSDLEQVWITDTPIAFVGALSDIANHNSGEYDLTLTEGLDLGIGKFQIDLALELACPKSLVDPMLTKYRKRHFN